jgi:hypothetical protein
MSATPPALQECSLLLQVERWLRFGSKCLSVQIHARSLPRAVDYTCFSARLMSLIILTLPGSHQETLYSRRLRVAFFQ